MIRWILLLCLLFSPLIAMAEPGIPAVTVTTAEDGGQNYTVSLQILTLMTLLTFLPAALMMMTSFTRIIIVLSILRQAMGVQSTPSNQILVGLSLFLTFFIMHPVFDTSYQEGVKPYIDGEMSPGTAIEKVSQPFKEFMLAQTRETDIELFASIAGHEELNSTQDVPLAYYYPPLSQVN